MALGVAQPKMKLVVWYSARKNLRYNYLGTTEYLGRQLVQGDIFSSENISRPKYQNIIGEDAEHNMKL